MCRWILQTFFLLWNDTTTHNPFFFYIETCVYRKQAIDERRPDINADFAGVYPWDWVGDDIASFKALQGGLLVAPILQKLILNRYPVVSYNFWLHVPYVSHKNS